MEKLRDFFVIDLAAKIRWRMQFDRNPQFIRLQDKFAVRQYAASRGVATAPLLHVTDDPTTIPFGDLPADYMIKANHGWGWNIRCREARHYLFGDGRGMAGVDQHAPDAASPVAPALTHDEVRTECTRWLQSRHAKAEWAYQHIPPRIIVEELLKPRDGTELLDYRFYTFDGKVKAINIGSPTYRRDHLNVFLDPAWNPIELSRYAEALPPVLPARPPCLPDMLAAAERLGAGLEFVRIDLYDTTIGVVLGEITVYPESGTRGMPTGCRRFNHWLGEQWRMSRAGECAVLGWNVAGLVPSIAFGVLQRARRIVRV